LDVSHCVFACVCIWGVSQGGDDASLDGTVMTSASQNDNDSVVSRGPLPELVISDRIRSRIMSMANQAKVRVPYLLLPYRHTFEPDSQSPSTGHRTQDKLESDRTVALCVCAVLCVCRLPCRKWRAWRRYLSPLRQLGYVSLHTSHCPLLTNYLISPMAIFSPCACGMCSRCLRVPLCPLLCSHC
jgi:hypothetical protein